MLVTECGKSRPDSRCHKMMQKHLVFFQQLTEVSRSNESYITWNTLSLCVYMCVCVCMCACVSLCVYILCVCVCGARNMITNNIFEVLMYLTYVCSLVDLVQVVKHGVLTLVSGI